MSRSKPLDYRIVAAFDTETTNLDALDRHIAFPCLYQIGCYNGAKVSYITPDNVETCVNVSLYRSADDVYDAFDQIIAEWAGVAIPVIMVHHLGFDMYAIAEYLNRFTVEVIAKSSAKPITFKLKDEDDNTVLVFWDTLSFTAKSLETMGRECRYEKAVGAWDYNLIRTPETLLTDEEKLYASRDIYTLFAYMGYYLRLNAWIDERMLGLRIITKTGVVRAKRDMLFSKAHGKGLKMTCGQFWHMHNIAQAPVDDDELYTMHAVTRGGFTFTANRYAGVPFDLHDERIIAGFDAVSQHPAQMTGHLFPVGFKKASAEVLDIDAKLAMGVTLDELLENLAKPFPVAFNACFYVEGLRLKAVSVFERDGIAPLASERLRKNSFPNEDNQATEDFANLMRQLGYKDTASGAHATFGKLNAADSCVMWLTELEMWIIAQCYDFDSISAISGYETGHFVKPTDYSVASVMSFFDAKNKFKDCMRGRGDYEALRGIAPDYLIDAMQAGTADQVDVDAYYQILKSDLNALYGIEITNEAKPNQYLDSLEGIVNAPSAGLDDMPDKPKTWYQFGQRIVGWSRVAQVVHMLLAEPHVIGFVNGDTDSLKMLMRKNDLPALKSAYSRYEASMRRAREAVCERVRRCYPDHYRDLGSMGAYEHEDTMRRYCSAWNKAYIADHDGHLTFTLAGVPTSRRKSDVRTTYDDMANDLIGLGWSFADVANRMLGYNTAISHSITYLNGRAKPPWGSRIRTFVRDYQGNTSLVDAPAVLALYPEDKIIGSTAVPANAANARVALGNNPELHVDPAIIWHDGQGFRIEEVD